MPRQKDKLLPPTLLFDLQLFRDLLPVWLEAHGSAMPFVLIQATRHSLVSHARLEDKNLTALSQG